MISSETSPETLQNNASVQQKSQNKRLKDAVLREIVTPAPVMEQFISVMKSLMAKIQLLSMP